MRAKAGSRIEPEADTWTPADLAREKRAGWIGADPPAPLIRLIGAARMEERDAHGSGNRAARRRLAVAHG